jgi:hypothetical protein
MTLVLAWPAAIALYAAGLPLPLVVPAMACAGAAGATISAPTSAAAAARVLRPSCCDMGSPT